MKWNLRLAAANRGVWKASELKRMLAERGVVISAGKMSGLWSGQPNAVRLDELDVICAVLGCGVEDLLLPEPDAVPEPVSASESGGRAAAAGQGQTGRQTAQPQRTFATTSMICVHCSSVFDDGRRDRLYCSRNCRKRASEQRVKAGIAPPRRWRHPALSSQEPALHAAVVRAEQIGQAHGWSATTRLGVLDGLTALLRERPSGEPVPLSEVRAQASQYGRGVRIAEVLADVELLTDDTIPAIRSWIERRSAELPTGFAGDVRAWMLMLLDGDARNRPRSPMAIYSYFGSLRPLLQSWSTTRGNLREITAADVRTALEPVRGWRRSNTITALRSLSVSPHAAESCSATPPPDWPTPTEPAACYQ